MVGHWIRTSRNWIDKVSRNSKSVSFRWRVFYPKAEKKLYNWIIDQRKVSLAVNYSIIRVKMLEIIKELDIVTLYDDLTNSFRLSNCWLYAFMKRQKLSLRQCIKIRQKFPN